ncbi:MAG: hypothetical protein EOO69_03640 [Moraxellaceae bacterium]|nr:MAG: hypothetical protein EOO69_03640 [Moraxellaceae bacterium]
MPLFAITCTDAPDSLAKRLEVRPRHLERLKALNEQGRVILAGPCPKNAQDTAQGFYGSLLVLDFADRASLDAWLAEEPYLLEGVYSHIDVKPFIKALP